MIGRIALRRPPISPAVVVLGGLIVLAFVVAMIRYANGLGAMDQFRPPVRRGVGDRRLRHGVDGLSFRRGAVPSPPSVSHSHWLPGLPDGDRGPSG